MHFAFNNEIDTTYTYYDKQVAKKSKANIRNVLYRTI